MSSQANGSLAVPLPQHRDSSLRSRPPVWALDSSNANVPLPAKCDRHGRKGGVCCKELKDEDDRTLINPDIVRDVVIGLSDGLTVPFALTAGLSSLGESRLVVLGGTAELIAGAISMGIGGFLASQAERDHYRFLKRHTSSRVLRSCEGEMEREVFAILGPVGVDEHTSRAVTKSLCDIECDNSSSASDEETQSPRWKSDVGLTPFLLKFGVGLEEVPTSRVYGSAITIGLGYLIGGIIPLFPYFFFSRAHIALIYSCLLTGFVLLIFGAVKARVTGAGQGIKGYLWGAVSTLLVGGAAAAAAYGIVALLET
ncbi:VIT family-domain-containing protein [Boletus reticuloceps]|uniref:VIT family-domain-containing protein n=1 Tax=Boletus reticuloceps TaxID=495285 RepID=A0A8I3ACC6_9AGAM|nr:VIT family-domain-containing protein [Boletus reticuloceps]